MKTNPPKNKSKKQEPFIRPAENSIKAIYSCVDETEIKIPDENKFDLFDIVNEAIYHYNEDKREEPHSFYSDKYCQPIDEEDEDIEDISIDWTRQYGNSTDEDIECLRRVILKFLRRYCTDYDWRLGYILTHFSSSLTRQGLLALKNHIEEEAIKKYPELEEEKFGEWLREQCGRHKGCLASKPRIFIRIR